MKQFPATSELVLFLTICAVFWFAIRLSSGSRYGVVKFLVRRVTAFAQHLCDSFSFPRRFVVPELSLKPGLKNVSTLKLFIRFKFTLFMLFLNIYTYVFTTDFNGKISPSILDNLGFSYTNFSQHHWFILVTSNFIHFHVPHLVANMAMLIVFSGSLELLKGSRFAALAYLAAMNSNVPNGLFLLPTLRIFSPDLWADTVQYVDVGASLGILGSLGGLARLLIPWARWTLMGCAVIGTTVGAIYMKTLFGLDHAFSALIGYFVVSYLLKNPTEKMAKKDKGKRVPLKHSSRARPKKTGTHD